MAQLERTVLINLVLRTVSQDTCRRNNTGWTSKPLLLIQPRRSSGLDMSRFVLSVRHRLLKPSTMKSFLVLSQLLPAILKVAHE